MNSLCVEPDRTLLNFSSGLTKPFTRAFELVRFRLFSPLDLNQFDNNPNCISELSHRTLIVLGTLLAAYTLMIAPVYTFSAVVISGVVIKAIRSLGFYLQKDGSTHVSGNLPEQSLPGEVKVMTWNVCGLSGGMHYQLGGLIPWRKRVDRIIEKIQEQDADVVVLEEVFDADLAEIIIARLKNQYAHFYIHLNPNLLGLPSGGMAFTKGACNVKTHDFHNNDWMITRGFVSLDLKRSAQEADPFIRIIGTHMYQGYGAKGHAKRQEQFEQIRTQASEMPTVVMGDFNMERDQMPAWLNNSYTGSDITCTNVFTGKWTGKKQPNEEIIDNIATAGNVDASKCQLIDVFEGYRTKEALSDHQPLVTTVRVRA